MRDAFGGVFTMNFLLVFIFIFVAFTAVSLNYAKAFKVKNAVIDFVEQNEISSIDATSISGKLSKLDRIIAEMGYNVSCANIGYQSGPIIVDSEAKGYCYKGIAILFMEKTNIKSMDEDTEENVTVAEKITYKIYTGANWNLGALNKILALGGKPQDSEEYIQGTWTINGEANVVIQK